MNLAHSRVLIYFYVFIVFQHNVDEVFSGNSGKLVSLTDTIKGFKGICNGDYDHLPESAFYMIGCIEEAIEKAKAA